MAVVQGTGAGGGQTKKKKKKKEEKQKILARKSRTPIYPPQKDTTKRGGTPSFVPREERGRPKEDRNIPEYLRPKTEEPIPEVSMGARFDPRTAATTEGTVRAITDPYFTKHNALPDYVTVAQLMQDKKYAPRDEAQRDALWEPILDAIDPEVPYLMAGDFFQITEGREAANRIAYSMGVRMTTVTQDTINNPATDTPIQPDWNIVNQHLDVMRSLKRSRYPDVSDFLIGQSELGKVYAAYYDRLVERGVKPNFKRDSAEYTPEVDYAVRMGIFGRQLCWAVIPTENANAPVVANEVIRKLRQGGFGQDFVEKTAQQLGLDTNTEMMRYDTAAGLLSALQVNDNEIVRQALYDGWEYGRPVGQTKSQARREFVAAFGKNRLPEEQLKLFEQENRGLMAVMDVAGEAYDKTIGELQKVPYLADVVSPVAKVVGGIDRLLFTPIQYTMQAATAGKIIVFSVSHEGWDYERWRQEVTEHGGESEMLKEHPRDFNPRALIDLGAWASAWEQSEGRTPFATIAETFDIGSDGRLGQASGQIGQLADFAVMMYIGSKFDIVLFGKRYRLPDGTYKKQAGVAQVTGKLGWQAGRVTARGLSGALNKERTGYFLRGQAGMLNLAGKVKPPAWQIGMEMDVTTPLFSQSKDSIVGVRMKLRDVTRLHEEATGKTIDELQQVRGRDVDVQSNTNLDSRFIDGKPVDPMVAVFIWDAATKTGRFGKDFQDGIHRMQRALAHGIEEGPVAFIIRDTNNHNIRVADHPEAVKALMEATGGTQWKWGERIEAVSEQLAIGDAVVGPEANGRRIVRLSNGRQFEADAPVAEQVARMNESGLVTSKSSFVDKRGEIDIDLKKTHDGLPQSDIEKMATDIRNAAKYSGARIVEIDGGLKIVGSPKQLSGFSKSYERYSKNIGKPAPLETRVIDRDFFEDTQVTTFYDPVTDTFLHARGENLSHLAVMQRILKLHGSSDEVKEFLGRLITVTPNHYGDVPEIIIHGTRAEDVADMRWLRSGANPSHIGRIIGRLSKSKAIDWDVDVRWTRPGREDAPAEISDIIERAHVLAKGNRADPVSADIFEFGRNELPNPSTEITVDVPKGPRGLVGGQEGMALVDLFTGGLVGRWVTSGGTSKYVVQSWVPPKWLSTNAELLTRVDNPYTIVKMYGITNDSPEVKQILKDIAKEKDPAIIETHLRELEQHGITIDAGAAAAGRAARLRLMERGIGDVGWSRIFGTMTTYGRSQPIEHAADNIEAVGSAVRLGGGMSKQETLGHLRRLAEKAWEADDAGTQKVVDEMWELVEKNLGPEGIRKYKEYERKIYWWRGQRYQPYVASRAYFGGTKDGVPGAELSLVADPKLLDKLPREERRAIEKFTESYNDERKRLKGRVDFLTAEMIKKYGSAAPKKGSTLSGDLTRTQKELAELDRLVQGAIHPDIQTAMRDVAALAAKLGADPKDLAKLADAVRVSAARTQRYADIMDVFARLGGKRRLRQTAKKGEKFSEQEQWDNAMKDLEEFRTIQPFKMGQTRKHIVHKYDPRIMGWYMSGKPVQTFMKLDQGIFEPLIRIFKETVMATMGFPIRVNVGDELVRLIPEGVFVRYYRSADRRTIRKTVVDELGNEHAFEDFDVQLHQAISSDFDTTENPDEWTMILPHEPEYARHLVNDLKSWSVEPIVIRLINSNIGGKGNFPTDVKKIRQFIRKLRDERDANGNLTPDAEAIRAHLNNTLRSDRKWKTRNGKKVLEDVFDTKMFEEWLDGWESRMRVIAENEPLRQLMTGKVDMNEFSRWVDANKEKLWPVNAPVQNGVRIRSKNPLYKASYLNPFHYVYSNSVFGTQKMLGIIGNKVKTALFNDRYYTLRGEILAKHPNIDKNELHQMCAESALKHANQASYSRSTTMFEDMARNMLPFVSAYRQFWLYWGKLALTHPFTMSTVRQAYPDLFEDPFAFAKDDYQFLIPQIPFWGPQPEEGDKGMWGLVKSQLPSFSFLGVLPARAGLAAMGYDPQAYSNLPMMAGLDHGFAPYKRQANLLYGITGTTVPDELGWLFGDPDKLEKAHINAVLSWMRYGPEATGAEIQEEAPIWAQVLNKISFGKAKPEALWGELIKTYMPIGTYYSPEPVRNRQGWLAEYSQLKTEQAKALYRMNNKWLDTYLDYYEADNNGKAAMRLDPANADHLKWWASPYDYSLAGDVVDTQDFQGNMLNPGRSRKDEEYLKRFIHNWYTDVYGGVYVALERQSGGEIYQGDIEKQKALKLLKKKTEDALQWAKDVAHAYHLKYGWDESDMMYEFEHPGGVLENGRRTGWGIWNSIIKEKGLNPYDYDIKSLDRMFNQQWEDKNLKTSAYNASSEDLLKAFGLTGWMVDPKLAKKYREASGDVENVGTSRKELKQKITEVTTQIASDQWYYIKSDQLEIIGIKADPRIDIAQKELKKAWQEWHKHKAGTDEYKDGRNAYYARQRKLLGGLEGGDALIGGLADRLEHIPYFTKPRLISVGSGRNAARQAAAWDDYVRVRNAEMKKDNPSKEKIYDAWEKFAGESGDKGSGELENKVLERGRVRIWHYILEEAKRYRKILIDSDSDYYEAKGNSVTSKFGQKYLKDISATIKNGMEANPLFAKDVEEYFTSNESLGSHLIDWYNY